MVPTLFAGVHLGIKPPPTFANTRLHSTRNVPYIRCSNGSQREGSESPGDWDASWEKLKEKRGKLEGVSGAESTKTDPPKSDFVRKDSELGDGRDVGPRLTKWGGSVRGGRYRLGEGADRILEFWGNGDIALSAAVVVIVLIFVLLQFKPPAAPL